MAGMELSMGEKKESVSEDVQSSDAIIKERIKKRPINKYKLARRTIITAAMAVVFAIVACLVFTILEPVLSNWLYPEEEPQIMKFPEETDEILPEDMLTDEEEEQENAGPSYEETEGIVDQQISQMFASFKLDIDDYKTLYAALGQVAHEAENAMVTVTGVKNDVDWFDNVYQSKGQTSGIVIGDNGKQLLVLARKDNLEEAETILVTFTDGTQNTAQLKQSDKNTGLAVYTVELEEMLESTRNSVQIARLGSSNSSSLAGTPIIAIGSPMGTAGSVGYGMITSSEGFLSMVDTSFRLLNTDIYGSTNATGIIINLQGQVLGVIDNKQSSADMRNMICAIGITELKPVIEKLSNGTPMAYLGIHGGDVPYAAHTERGVPFGAYVTEIEMGSPAMEAGIQSGDVIVQIGEISVNNMSELTKELNKLEPETEVELIVQRQGQEEYLEMELVLTLEVFE